MGRKPNSNVAKNAHRIISEHPGISSGELSQRLGLKDRRSIENILASCEANGLLVSEDDEWEVNKSKRKDRRLVRVTKYFPWSLEDSERGNYAE